MTVLNPEGIPPLKNKKLRSDIEARIELIATDPDYVKKALREQEKRRRRSAPPRRTTRKADRDD